VSDLRIFWHVLVRDPSVVFGLLLCGVPTIVWWYMCRMLGERGFKAYWWGAHVEEYVRTRAKYGWSAWPLHVMWLSLVFGISLLVIGVSKL
jgi:hypothetical protein